jgi:putative FmdB family regulatory protein
MPLYRFLCPDCQSDFEELLPRPPKDAEGKPACPNCASENTNQVFGLPSVGSSAKPATNCRGDGPPCGASFCGRRNARN